MRQVIKFERPQTRLAFDNRILGFTVSHKDEETTINVSGVIGESWDGLDAASMAPMIQDIKTPIVLRLNTPGGFLLDALDIYDALIEHPHHVRADIVAEAWSAGTVITAAADEVRIRPAAKYGLHRAWSGMLLVGNEEEITAQVEEVKAATATLRKLDLQIAEMISKRAGVDLKTVHDWMIGPEGVDGTEFVGKEAVDHGLADALITSEPLPAAHLAENRAFRAAARKRLVQAKKMRSAAAFDTRAA